MHMKFERFSLFLTLFPMLIFCIMMLVFMPDSMRLTIMRVQVKRARAAPLVASGAFAQCVSVLPHGGSAEHRAREGDEHRCFYHDGSSLRDSGRIFLLCWLSQTFADTSVDEPETTETTHRNAV